MDLENFELKLYNPNFVDHKTVIIELYNDKEGKLYLGDLEYQIQAIERRKEENYCNGAYIAYFHNKPIGYISLTCIDDIYQVSYGIRPSFRGMHLGALLLQEFTEKVFESYNRIDKLTLIINNLNTGSKKTAKLAGYKQETSTRFTQHRV